MQFFLSSEIVWSFLSRKPKAFTAVYAVSFSEDSRSLIKSYLSSGVQEKSSSMGTIPDSIFEFAG